MPERQIFLNNGTTPIYTGHLNPDDEVTVETDDDGNLHIEIVNQSGYGSTAGYVEEVSVGPGAAGGVVKVWPPNTEAQAVAAWGEAPDNPTEGTAQERKEAAALSKKLNAEGQANPAPEEATVGSTAGAGSTAGETPPESGGQEGTGFSGQVKP